MHKHAGGFRVLGPVHLASPEVSPAAKASTFLKEIFFFVIDDMFALVAMNMAIAKIIIIPKIIFFMAVIILIINTLRLLPVYIVSTGEMTFVSDFFIFTLSSF